MESRRVEAVVEVEEEEERAVEGGGLPARPLNHSQVFVVTQSGVSVQSSISRWDSGASCESDFTVLRGRGVWLGVILKASFQLCSVDPWRPLADLQARCIHKLFHSSTTH